VQVSEPDLYAPESRNSWFRDVKFAQRGSAEAADRLRKASEHEQRALSSTDAEGGYLVAPAYLQSEFIDLVTAGSPVANACSKHALPPNTDAINIPKLDTGTAVAVATENNNLTETSAAFTTVAATVYRVGGRNVVPTTLIDRAVPGIDMIIMRDLARRLALLKEDHVIDGSGSGEPEGILQADSIGTATYTAGTATLGGLWPVLLNAILDVRSGHYREPSHIVMHPRRWAWMQAQVDSTDSRPYVGAFNPFNAMASNSGQAYDGAIAGQILGIPVLISATVPTTLGSGTDEDRIIVGCLDECMLYEAAPKFAVSTDSNFNADQTSVRVTQDWAFTAERYPAALSVISGTGLNDTI
jgi:HK97 family phage major capsid protein